MYPKLTAPKTLTKAEQRRLLRAVRAHGSPRDRALLSLALSTGLRLRELAGLNVGDVSAGKAGTAWKIVLDPALTKGKRGGWPTSPPESARRSAPSWRGSAVRRNPWIPGRPCFYLGRGVGSRSGGSSSCFGNGKPRRDSIRSIPSMRFGTPRSPTSTGPQRTSTSPSASPGTRARSRPRSIRTQATTSFTRRCEESRPDRQSAGIVEAPQGPLPHRSGYQRACRRRCSQALGEAKSRWIRTFAFEFNQPSRFF